MKRAAPKSVSSARPPVDVAGIAIAFAAVALLFLLFVLSSGDGPVAHDPVGPDDAHLASIEYRVDDEEWARTQRPSLCQVVHHHGLGEAAAAATLYLNRGNGECADGAAPLAPGASVRLAIWADPDLRRCRAVAAKCPQRSSARPEAP